MVKDDLERRLDFIGRQLEYLEATQNRLGEFIKDLGGYHLSLKTDILRALDQRDSTKPQGQEEDDAVQTQDESGT